MDGHAPWGWECKKCYQWWDQDPNDLTNPEAADHDVGDHSVIHTAICDRAKPPTDEDMEYVMKSLGVS